MFLIPPLSTESASEISVRVRLSFTGPTVLHGEFSKFFKCTRFRHGALFYTLVKGVAREIVFQPLHPDTGAPLLEERVTF